MFLATKMFLATLYEHMVKDPLQNAGVSLPSFFSVIFLPCKLRRMLGEFRLLTATRWPHNTIWLDGGFSNNKFILTGRFITKSDLNSTNVYVKWEFEI